jgi:hypothetical protein
MNFLAGSRGSISVILRGTKALVMAWRLRASGVKVRVDDQRYLGKARSRGPRRPPGTAEQRHEASCARRIVAGP